jgi:hypothetical protein
MHHLEEINNGQTFTINNTIYIATCDFDNNKKRLCIDILSGQLRWLLLNSLVELVDLYKIDNNNNIINIRGNNDIKN